jgi:AhpD family alkylhydroperoxidase
VTAGLTTATASSTFSIGDCAAGRASSVTKAASRRRASRNSLASANSSGRGCSTASAAYSTAQLNGCEYCLSAHTYIGANIAKVEPAELDKARKGQSDDPHVAALLKLSNDIAENAGDVDDADVKAAREAGVTDEEIGELVANLALNILTNYFNILAHVDNDWPVVSL